MCSVRSPEWAHLAGRAWESAADYKHRMKGLGLGIHSRVSKRGELIIEALQATLNISQAKARAILGPPARSGEPDRATGMQTDEEAAQHPDREAESDADSEDSLLADPHAGRPPNRWPVLPPPPPLPPGFVYMAHRDSQPLASGRYNLRQNLAVKCPQDGAVRKLWKPLDIKEFLAAHASCMCASCLLCANSDRCQLALLSWTPPVIISHSQGQPVIYENLQVYNERFYWRMGPHLRLFDVSCAARSGGTWRRVRKSVTRPTRSA